MTDFALPAPYRLGVDTPGKRFARGLRRIDTGLRLIRLGLGDLALATLQAISLLLAGLVRAPARVTRAMAEAVAAIIRVLAPAISPTAWLRGLAHLATGIAQAISKAVAAIISALAEEIDSVQQAIAAVLRPPANVFSIWMAWAWSLTRPILRAIVMVFAFLVRFAVHALAGFAAFVAFLAFTPLVGFLADGLARLAAAGGEDLSRWLSDWAPTSADLAALPWTEIGGLAARFFWACVLVLTAGVAVAALAFGLWLLALSAYVAARSVAVATPPALRAAQGAGMSMAQALVAIAMLLARALRNGSPVLTTAALIGIIFSLALLFDPNSPFTPNAADTAVATTRAEIVNAPRQPTTKPDTVRVAPRDETFTPVRPPAITSYAVNAADGGVFERSMIFALSAGAAVLAFAMLLTVFAEGSGRARAIFAGLIALLVFGGLAWVTAPSWRSSVQSFIEACASFLDRGSRPVLAQSALAETLPVAPETAAFLSSESREVSGEDPPPLPTEISPEAPSADLQAAQAVLIFPAVPMSWVWGSAGLAVSDVNPEQSVGLDLDSLDLDALCRADALLAVGAASSDGARDYNEALASRRARTLAQLAADAAARCPPPGRPAVLTLDLGQSLASTSIPSQRAVALLTLSGGAVDKDDVGGLAIPFDQSSYSKATLCLYTSSEAGVEVEPCSP